MVSMVVYSYCRVSNGSLYSDCSGILVVYSAIVVVSMVVYSYCIVSM